jgi:predicted  nucleic acid-binding Zn-ribbon protein
MLQLAHIFCYLILILLQLTNTLQKKLDQVRREKAQLVKIIEQEQMHHSHLENKLTDIREGAPEEPKILPMDALGEGEEGDEDEEDLEREDHMEEEP